MDKTEGWLKSYIFRRSRWPDEMERKRQYDREISVLRRKRLKEKREKQRAYYKAWRSRPEAKKRFAVYYARRRRKLAEKAGRKAK